MHKDIERILITEEELQSKVRELGAQITKDYKDKNLFVISILKGAFIFAADLLRSIELDAPVDFMIVSSYGNSTKSSGAVKIVKDLDKDVKDLDILIAEDVLDTGLTLKYVTDMLLHRGAKSVKICTMLNKPSRRKVELSIDYKGFDIPDEFVVGYGLDFAEKYRGLPYIGILSPSVYDK